MTPPAPNTHLHNTDLDVLVVENDPAMACLMVECCWEAGLGDHLMLVPDGDEALALLRRQQKYADSPPPDIIFLDLHLPRKSGLQVLSEIKQDRKLQLTPVVVVSGSDDPNEVREAYELHANNNKRKPHDLDEFFRFMQVSFE